MVPHKVTHEPLVVVPHPRIGEVEERIEVYEETVAKVEGFEVPQRSVVHVAGVEEWGVLSAEFGSAGADVVWERVHGGIDVGVDIGSIIAIAVTAAATLKDVPIKCPLPDVPTKHLTLLE